MTFLLLAAAALANGAIESELWITSVDGFVEFKDNVNKGTNYSGTTVFLDSDLSFTGKSFEPIGNRTYYFSGVFDGQGHVISNLRMTSSSSEYVGLFGYSTGLTIKNVILDSSSSITSSYGSGNAYACGIIGNCWSNNGPCIIENSVNMGSVSFSGAINDKNLYLGGIAGCFSSSSDYNSIVKSCANYGNVTHYGKSGTSYIGGVVGLSSGSSSSNRVYIYNSLNHGIITHSGTTSIDLHLGGISGWIRYTTIENCVGGGKFSLSTKAASNNNIGIIVGIISDDTSITYTYFTSDLSDYGKYGRDTPTSESNTPSYDSTSFELSGTVSIGSYTGTSLIDALNAVADYYALREYSRWILNKGKRAVSFTINGRTNSINMNTQVILLPSLASGGKVAFDGWYTDDGLTTPLTEFEVMTETELYGKYCGPNFTITLDANGGDELTVKEMIIGCDRVYGELPTSTRTEYTFLGWFTETTGGDKIESGGKVTIHNNHTLYAHWSVKKYTLTFILGNGDEPEVRTLDFNEAITYPAEPVRVGYSFAGWDKNITNMPADNTTITALWTANKYTVTFNPSEGSVSQSTTKAVTFGSTYGELPTPNRTGHTFLGWFTEKGESITRESIVEIAGNHTLYAHWSINKYTVRFDGNGGTVPQHSIEVTFNSPYGDLPTPNKTGHTFLGWFTEKNESITAESIVKTPDNHTLFAHWLEVTQSQVEIVFSTKDMDKKEIEAVIKKYTDADFTITVIENDADGIRVIAEFVDEEEAEEFVRKVDAALDRGEGDKIKSVYYRSEKGTPAFSPAHLPMSLLYLL